MSNVKTVVQKTKQPYGGYMRVRDMKKVEYGGGELRNRSDTMVTPQLVGMAVDYLTRFYLGYDAEESFAISLLGAQFINDDQRVFDLLDGLNPDEIDDKSIKNACQLVGYDVIYRAGIHAYKPVEQIQATENTIHDIRIMVKRSVAFFEEHGPITMNGMTFEGGYTDKVKTGDADILTETGLWDLKVLKSPITSKDTLQILMYYVMGLNSIHKEEFEKVNVLGFYNPRLDVSYTMNVDDVGIDVLDTIATEVIGYK